MGGKVQVGVSWICLEFEVMIWIWALVLRIHDYTRLIPSGIDNLKSTFTNPRSYFAIEFDESMSADMSTQQFSRTNYGDMAGPTTPYPIPQRLDLYNAPRKLESPLDSRILEPGGWRRDVILV